MTIARSEVDLMGALGAFQTVGAGAELAATAADLLGDNASVGEVTLLVQVTGAAAGSIDLMVYARDAGGSAHYPPEYEQNLPVASGTLTYKAGRYSATRRLGVKVRNNDGSNSVDVWVRAELEKLS